MDTNQNMKLQNSKVSDLGRMKAEHTEITKVGDRPVAHFYTECVSGIIDEFQIVPLCNISQYIKLAGMTVDVNRQDRCCPGRDGRFHLLRVDSVILGLNVHEDRSDLVPGRELSPQK